MIINIRTRDDLAVLLAAGQSGDWVVSPVKEAMLTTVRIFDWQGDSVLIGDFDPHSSYRNLQGRLIIGIARGRIMHCQKDWYVLYGQSPIVYGENIAIQIHGGIRIGIVRQLAVDELSNTKINEYFKRLIQEIKLQEITTIVFCSGGLIPIPDFFIEWCQQNGVTIEIINDNEIARHYSTQNDLHIDEVFQMIEI